MDNRQTDATAGRLNLWGRTTRVRAEQAAAVEPRSLRIARLLAMFTRHDAAKGEAFVDTVPSVMFDRD